MISPPPLLTLPPSSLHTHTHTHQNSTACSTVAHYSLGHTHTIREQDHERSTHKVSVFDSVCTHIFEQGYDTTASPNNFPFLSSPLPSSRSLGLDLPKPEDPPPALWWNLECDQSLIVGILKHGMKQKYALLEVRMRVLVLHG